MMKKLRTILSKIKKLKRFRPAQIIFTGILFMGIATAVAITFFSVKETEAAWFDDAWLYRSPVVITNGSDGVLTDFQVKITVDSDTLYTASKVQADCDDLRFADVTGNLLPYWIEDTASASEAITCNAADIDVWVKVPTLATTGSTIYMYYGNTNATAGKNGKDTFDFFEDFSAGSLDSVRWAAATGSTSIANGEITITTGAIYTNNTILSTAQNYVYEQRVKWTTTSGSYSGLMIADDQDIAGSNGGSDALAMFMAPSSATYGITGFGATGSVASYDITSGTTGYTATVDTYHVSGFSLDSTNLRFYNNRTQVSSHSGTWTVAPYLYLGYFSGSTAAATDVKDMTTDWIIARKYASSVPTAATGTEEKGSAPVGYWSLDEGYGTAVYDPGGSNGTLTCGGSGCINPAWKTESDCISGNCLHFYSDQNTVGAYVDIASTSNTTIKTNQLSVSLWIKPNSIKASGQDVVLWKQDDDYDLRFINGLLRLSIGGVGGSTYLTALVPNRWYHVVGVFDGTTTKLYINGQLGSSAATTGTMVSDGGLLRIARDDGTNRYFNGYIDEVKIYHTAKSAAQIRDEYISRGSANAVSVQAGANSTAIGATLSNGLAAYYPMDETAANSCSGGVNDTCDKSGNVNNLAWDANDPDITTGKYGNGLDFETSTSDFASIADNTGLSITGSLTMSAWIKPETIVNSGIISKDGGSSPSRGYYMSVQTNKLRFALSDLGTSVTYRDSSTSLTAGVWQHVAVVYNQTARSMDVYLNGVLDQGSVTGTIPSSLFDNTVDTRLGYGPANGYFDGIIDEARIYSRALSPAEIRALSNWAPGPIGHWKMDENTSTTANDFSGNNNPATLNGATWTQGKYGSAVQFDGNTDYMSVADSNLLDLTTALTISNWVYLNDTIEMDFVGKWMTGGLGAYYFGQDGSGNLLLALSSDGSNYTEYLASAPGLTTGSWHHIAASWNTVDDIAVIYFDGQALATTLNFGSSPSSLFNSSTELNIGSKYEGGYGNVSGSIDDVKIYNYVRTSGQIIEDMNGGHPLGGSPVGSQVLYWKFDEGYGTNAEDSSINGFDGTLTNSPTRTNAGKLDKAITFDGSNDYITKSDNDALDLGTDPFTASIWIKATTPADGTHDIVIAKGATGPTSPGYFWSITTVGKLSMLLSDGASYIVNTASNGTISDGTWHHASFVWNPSSGYSVYIDGKLDKFVAVTSSTNINATFALLVGGFTSSNFTVNGTLDELKIYRAALTPEQIAVDYNLGKSIVLGSTSTSSSGLISDDSSSRAYCVPGDTATCNAPVLDLRMDENTSTTANDVSGNANTGTLTNGPTWGQGKYGSAVKFDGSDDSINVGSGSSLEMGTKNWTMGGWFKTADTTNRMRMITRQATGYYFMGFGTGNTLYYGLNDGTNTLIIESVSAASYRDNAWHHYMISIDRSSSTGFKVYIDGVLVDTRDPTAIGSVVPVANTQIGIYSATTQPFLGSLDNIRIYDYARTGAQIAWEYNQGAPLLHYRLDDCQGSTAYNSALNANGQAMGNNGTIAIGATGGNTAVGTCAGSAGQAWFDGATGKVSASLELDGTDDQISFSRDANIQSISSQGTISGWHYFNTLDSTLRTSVDIASSGNTGLIFYASGSTNKPQCQYGTGSGVVTLTATRTFSTSQWYHLTCTWSSSGGNLYINGVLEASSATAPGISITAGTGYIGSQLGNQRYFSGKIDEVKIYNYALTPTQIREVYNNGAINFN